MSHPPSPTFSASVIPGARRGRTIGTPTFNLKLEAIPPGLHHGIYACFAQLDDDVDPLPAVMHYGPRPVFNDTESCEVHIIDRMVDRKPVRLTVAIVDFIREIEDFPIPQVLQAQIASDIEVARAILGILPARP
ncbi:MAG: riboflavin kinase [Candidatus Peribacteraceae bacterium]|jgi:riboflavin kinase/FMN adenylyltransferase